MKKGFSIIITVVAMLLYCKAFNKAMPAAKGSGFADTVMIAQGEATFNRFCTGCHNFRQDGIGPQLGGVTSLVSAGWIQRFIKDPQKIISSRDERAQQLFKKFRTVMPSFSMLTNKDLNALIAFLSTQKMPDYKPEKYIGKELSNPVPEVIKLSNLVVDMKLVTRFPASGDSGNLPLARITKLDFQPNSGTSFVADHRGKLYKLINSKPFVYMDIAALKPAFIDHPGLATGFGSFAFHPQFGTNGLLYTTHSEPGGSAKTDFGYADSIKVTLQWVLTEWKVNDPDAATFSGTGRELLRVNMVAVNHGMQEITFNPYAKPGDEDYGLLYIGIGDGGSVEHGYPFLDHSPEKIWGTILRIDPAGRNSANGAYGIPPQNPFANDKNNKKLGEIYAYGFRNPHRITWTQAKQMLACNIGHGNIESVNLVLKGHDYGWPIREGSFLLNPFGNLNKVFPLPDNDSSYHVTYPIAQYDHDEGNAICGGFEYTGNAVPKLRGKFLFGDILRGRLFYFDLANVKPGSQALIKEWQVSDNGVRKSLTDLCGSKRVDLHFGKDAQGELYIMTKADGKLYKLIDVR